MVDPAQVFNNFKQAHNSCALAAFSNSVSRGARALAPLEFFEAYCSHFQIPHFGGTTAEAAYGRYIQVSIALGIRAFELILMLFHTSRSGPFLSVRADFTVEFIPDVVTDADRIDDILKAEEALLCVSIEMGRHAVVVGWSGAGAYRVDSNFPGTSAPVPSCRSLPDSSDGLLVRRRRDKDQPNATLSMSVQ